MTGKLSRGALVCAAIAATAGILTACSDSSTASAPLTQDVTTTKVDESAAKAVSNSTSVAPSSSAKSSEAAESSKKDAPKPKSEEAAPPAGVPTEIEGEKLSPKEEKYLASLKRQKVEFMGDADGKIALTMGHYVCQERAKKTDPNMIKVYVTAAVGPATKNEDQAGVQADKVINTATRTLC